MFKKFRAIDTLDLKSAPARGRLAKLKVFQYLRPHCVFGASLEQRAPEVEQ